MKFLSDYLEKDPSTNITNLLIFFFVFTFVLIIIAFVYDLNKNKKNQNKISILERAIKDLIEEFRQFELSISDQKKILNEYKYTLERLDQEISRLADSSKGDSNITEAIKMANEGKTIDEISELTGLSKEEIEPIIKFHGR
jgi:hypothetical protein